MYLKSVKKYRKSVKKYYFRKYFTSFSDNIKTVNKNEIFSDIFKFLYFWVIRGRILIALFLCISLLYHNYFVVTVIPVIITGLFYYRTNQLKKKHLWMFLVTFFQEIIFYFLWGCAFEYFVKINFHNVNKISQSLQKSCHYLSCIIR